MSVQAISQSAGLTDRERELGAIISAYSDVTERLKIAHERLNAEVARLSEELARKNAELRRRERLAALGQMAAGLAHEIRNPLGGIALYASMLEGQLGKLPKAQSAASRISQGVRELDRLVGEILDFAQEQCLEQQMCPLDDVIAGLSDSLRPWADEHGAGIVIEEAALAIEVYCDPMRLKRVLLNLMMNGVQATGEGGLVRLSARKTADGAEIEVVDNGPGISAENMDRIFNPFFTTRSTGTGLGLAIVHSIIEAHGGTIRVCNREEGGARFVIRLPYESREKAKATRSDIGVSSGDR